MRVRGAIVGLLVTAAFVLSGCQYLLGGMMGGPIPLPGQSFDPGDFGSFDPGDFGSFDPNDPLFSLPPPEATYTNGTATVTIDGTPTTYDKLVGTAYLMKDFGASVTWTDGAGHYLQLFGARKGGDATFEEEGIYLSLERVADGQHWTAADPAKCKVTITTVDKTGVTGTATCPDLRWSDMLAPYDVNGSPSFVAGQPAFDLEVTFKASP